MAANHFLIENLYFKKFSFISGFYLGRSTYVSKLTPVNTLLSQIHCQLYYNEHPAASDSAHKDHYIADASAYILDIFLNRSHPYIRKTQRKVKMLYVLGPGKKIQTHLS